MVLRVALVWVLLVWVSYIFFPAGRGLGMTPDDFRNAMFDFPCLTYLFVFVQNCQERFQKRRGVFGVSGQDDQISS